MTSSGRGAGCVLIFLVLWETSKGKGMSDGLGFGASVGKHLDDRINAGD